MLSVPARLSRTGLLVAVLIAFSYVLGIAAAARADASPARIHVWLKSPQPRRTVSGSLRCHVVVHARGGIRKVRFSLDGRHLNTRTAPPYNCATGSGGRFDTRKLSDGLHRLAFRAWNRTGRSRFVRFVFRVRNEHLGSSTSVSPNNSGNGHLLFEGLTPLSFDELQEAASDRIQESSDPLGGSRRVLRFSVPDSDVYPRTPTDNPRAQALTPKFIRPGMEFWVKDSFMLPSSYPSNIPWMTLLDVLGPPYAGSSPIAVMVKNDKIMVERNKNYGDDDLWSIPLVRNRWIECLMHMRFGRDGWVELWIDGQRITFPNGKQRIYTATRDSTNDGGPNYVKIANYRQVGSARRVTLYHSGFKVGLTSDSVRG